VPAAIDDEGPGFSAGGGGSDGLGLVGMKERVGLLDGRAEIESTEAGGSTTAAEVPLP
jgi:signal transduction histidine kinase